MKYRGGAFGDASTDRILLYALLGFGIYALSKVGAGLGNALTGIGNMAGAGGNLLSRGAGAINSILDGTPNPSMATSPRSDLDSSYGDYTLIPGASGQPPILGIGFGSGNVTREPDGSLWEPYDPATWRGPVDSGATGGW
jgi:hypothetical protein